MATAEPPTGDEPRAFESREAVWLRELIERVDKDLAALRADVRSLQSTLLAAIIGGNVAVIAAVIGGLALFGGD